MRTCSEEGCESLVFARGICGKHYQRKRKDGTLIELKRTKGTPDEIIADRIKTGSNGCVLWIGHMGSNGYGALCQKGKEIRAHRFVWETANGPIPDGLIVRHKCRNRNCVELTHLELGTHTQNNHDMVRDGTKPMGETHGAAILTEVDVLEIRGSNLSSSALANLYGVAYNTIRKVLTRNSWKHI